MLEAAPFEQAVDAARFNIKPLVATLLHEEPFSAIPDRFSNHLNQREIGKLVECIIRNVFLIEPVNRDVTSTKFAVRWTLDRARYFDYGHDQDPRWSSFHHCVDIAVNLINSLDDAFEDQAKRALFKTAVSRSVIPYEAPLDYLDTPFTDPPTAIHNPGNLGWYWGEESQKTFLLREFIHQLPGELGQMLVSALQNKIKVKTYLTDRAQTGPYQTNREKRWECHTNSVQFASRRTCWAIEHRLLEQVFFFEGFPTATRDAAIAAGAIEPHNDVARCPITLQPLSLEAFSNDVLDPSHGRSPFQVGHLNPLKTVSRSDPNAGHTAANISWISDLGNRIQGDMSLEGTHELILNIADRLLSEPPSNE